MVVLDDFFFFLCLLLVRCFGCCVFCRKLSFVGQSVTNNCMFLHERLSFMQMGCSWHCCRHCRSMKAVLTRANRFLPVAFHGWHHCDTHVWIVFQQTGSSFPWAIGILTNRWIAVRSCCFVTSWAGMLPVGVAKMVRHRHTAAAYCCHCDCGAVQCC